MEFDKSRVYTALNADELHEGDKVIVADDLSTLKEKVKKGENIETIREIYPEDCQERFDVEIRYTLAYLVERKENCTNCEYEGSAGCSVVEICGENKLTHRCHMYKAKDTKKNLCNSCKRSFAECPATANDIIFGDGVGNDNVYECDKYEKKEKHFRPFRDTDELIKVWCEYKCPAHNHRERGLTMPFIWVRSKFNEDHKGVLINNYFGKYVELNKVQCFLSRLFDEYTFLDGSPCGVEE